MSYKIKLELFEGPLDLLLYLVKKDHLNIYDIPIANVTEQYLAYLELMKFLDLNIAGEFLIMASTLMQIKSKMLLPAEESKETEGKEADLRGELIKQLLEYEKFKEIAEELRKKEEVCQDIFRKPKSKELDLLTETGTYFEASIFDLITAFSKAIKETPKELFYDIIKDEFTIEEKIHEILHLLLVRVSVSLTELFSQAKNKIEIIVIFLAILELIRLKEIITCQKELFGEIEIITNQKNIISDER